MPVRINLFAKFLDIFFANGKTILWAARQRFKFPIDPGTAAFRKDNARAHTFGAVADDQFFPIETNFYFF